MKKLLTIAIFSLANWSGLLLTAALAGDPLADAIGEVTNAPEFAHAWWGLLVTDLDSGEVLYERDADRLFVPASTTKLYSVAAALDAYGPDHRFETPIYANGQIDETGQLRGDLILVASGDLTLGGRATARGEIEFRDVDHTYASPSTRAELTSQDPLAGLKDLAAQVAANGIRRVDGNVLIDARLFDAAESTGSGPRRLSPIIINDNVVDVRISPTKVGQPATVEWRPKCRVISVDAEIETVASGEAHVDMWFHGNALVARGRVPADKPPLVLIRELPDPEAFARAALIEALEEAGVAVAASEFESPDQGPLAASLPDAREYDHLSEVARLTSAPFSEEIKLVLKVSHNLHASTLPLLLAAKHGKTRLSDGLRLQHEFLKRVGVPVETISFGGGAGGDAADRITPRATVALLRHMATRDDFDSYQAALPILGVDGTLAKAATDDNAAKGMVRAKTGTLAAYNAMNDRTLLTSKALAGYMTSRGGRQLAFAMFVNDVDIGSSADRDRIGRVLGAVCEKIYLGL